MLKDGISSQFQVRPAIQTTLGTPPTKARHTCLGYQNRCFKDFQGHFAPKSAPISLPRVPGGNTKNIDM